MKLLRIWIEILARPYQFVPAVKILPQKSA